VENQIVIFELAGEEYGVPISSVNSIIKMQPITRMPHTPEFVQGVTNLRGKVLPVVDLRQRFGLDPAETSKDSRIIVSQVEGKEVGMIVDGVSEVLTIQEQWVEEVPPITTTIESAFITGVVKIERRLVILIELEKVLSVDEKADLMEMD
jgi:purine-binding chemotaxis protein CheW